MPVNGGLSGAVCANMLRQKTPENRTEYRKSRGAKKHEIDYFGDRRAKQQEQVPEQICVQSRKLHLGGRAENQQKVFRVDSFANLNDSFEDLSRNRRIDVCLHLHRFNDEQAIALRYVFSTFDSDRGHCARDRCAHMARVGGVSLCTLQSFEPLSDLS